VKVKLAASWDWKDHVDAGELTSAIQEFGTVKLYLVPDTYADDYAMIACDMELCRQEVQEIWDTGELVLALNGETIEAEDYDSLIKLLDRLTDEYEEDQVD
jgi:hypothetical protein